MTSVNTKYYNICMNMRFRVINLYRAYGINSLHVQGIISTFSITTISSSTKIYRMPSLSNVTFYNPYLEFFSTYRM